MVVSLLVSDGWLGVSFDRQSAIVNRQWVLELRDSLNGETSNVKREMVREIRDLLHGIGNRQSAIGS
jgi:hypothetical protein